MNTVKLYIQWEPWVTNVSKIMNKTQKVYTLFPIQVRDQEIPVKRNFVKAVVHVEDCNDYTPTFMSTHYEGSISNLAPTGTEVLRVKALDKDKGSNAEIVYSIHSGNYIEAIILQVC